ncbi:MAG: hypothetical protein LR011_07965 [Verrucomicrobia bacterium]|nr:hypothetical protein [Verrucomicrobiota bacterium]
MNIHKIIFVGSLFLNGLLISKFIFMVKDELRVDRALTSDNFEIPRLHLDENRNEDHPGEIDVLEHLDEMSAAEHEWPQGNTLEEIREVAKKMADLGAETQIISRAVGPKLDLYYMESFYDVFKYRGPPWRKASFGPRDQLLLQKILEDLLESRNEDIENGLLQDQFFGTPSLWTDNEIYGNLELSSMGLDESAAEEIALLMDDSGLESSQKYNMITEKFGEDVALSVEVTQDKRYQILQKLVSLHKLGDKVADGIFFLFKQNLHIENADSIINSELSSLLNEQVFSDYRNLQ